MVSQLSGVPLRTALTGEAITRFNPYTAQLEGVQVRLAGLQAAYRIDDNVEYLTSAREAVLVKLMENVSLSTLSTSA